MHPGVELPITAAVDSMLDGLFMEQALEVFVMRAPGLESD